MAARPARLGRLGHVQLFSEGEPKPSAKRQATGCTRGSPPREEEEEGDGHSLRAVAGGAGHDVGGGHRAGTCVSGAHKTQQKAAWHKVGRGTDKVTVRASEHTRDFFAKLCPRARARE